MQEFKVNCNFNLYIINNFEEFAFLEYFLYGLEYLLNLMRKLLLENLKGVAIFGRVNLRKN